MNAKTIFILFVIGVAVSVLNPIVAGAQVATGGSYTLRSSVVANGGGKSADSGGMFYRIDGTAGQTTAGANGLGAPYGIRNGFWIGLAAPTAAGVEISGRVTGPNGRGLGNVKIAILGGTLTTPLIVRTNQFGNFSFGSVEAGQTYIVTAISRRYSFKQSQQLITPLDNVTDLTFQAEWEN